jgi:glutamine amidotransferase
MITIIDYGVGNLHSISKVIENLGKKVLITKNKRDLVRAEAIILPGVGAFKPAMLSLRQNSLIEPIKKLVLSGKPIFGICLGLQLFFSISDEGGKTNGLDIIKGKVELIKKPVKLPQIGWNTVKQTKKDPLFNGIPDNSYFYFVHSYHVIPETKLCITGKTKYGLDFVSVIHQNNVTGTQFHPEKSSDLGLKLIENWIKNLC